MFHFILNVLPRPLLISLSFVFSHIAPFIYYGNRYEDPISGKSYRKFLPYGLSKKARRKNVLCPGSLSLERHRLIWLYLKYQTDFFSRKYKMLHIAPEQCFYKVFKKQKTLDYMTGDYNSPIADLHFDLHQIPFPENSFDVIFCNHVLEHVANAEQCMNELYRVMRPGGWGIFLSPVDLSRKKTYEDKNITCPKEREIHFWQKDHLRLFGLDYKDKLADAGFDVTVEDFASRFSAEQIDRYRLSIDERIYLCKK